MTARIPLRVDDLPERQAHTWEHLIQSGLIWYLNRSLFHPLGYAIAVENIDDPSGWTLHYAGEPIYFEESVDEDAKFAALQELLATAREHGASPETGIPYFGSPEAEQ